MTMHPSDRQTRQTLCRMCSESCALNVCLENGRIVEIEGFAGHPYNKGVVCSKAPAAIDLAYHPDRILRPLKKTAAGWQEIPLTQALDEIAARVKKIQTQYGERSMSVWKGEAIGFAQEEDIARRFIHAIGSPNYFSNDTACWLGKYIGYSLGYGQWQQPDFPHSRCMMLWGTNPPYSQAMWTRGMMEAKGKGAKLIVVDPRLSAIARQADIHAALRPGTDGALAWGLIRLLVDKGWYDRDFIRDYTVGFDQMAAYAQKFSLEFVRAETGISPELVLEMARLLHEASPQVAFYMGNGMEHHLNGVQNVRAASCLDALCGSLDQKGGNRLLEGPDLRPLTLYEVRPLLHLEPIGADRYPVFYGFRQECHTMLAMDTILSGDPYPLRGMIITAANPAMTNPNSAKVRRALASLDLLVVRDLFMTETAELADYLLPAATFLEREEVVSHSFYQVLNLRQKLIEFPDVQDEYQFWHDLAHRLGAGGYFPWKNEREMNRWLLEPTGITLEDLADHPEGVTYKPIRYEKWRTEPLATPSGKVEIASLYLKNLGYPELPEYQSPDYACRPQADFPLVLITGARKMLFLHSRYRNIPRFRTAVPDPELEMHPLDAGRIGVKSGDRVRVTSRVGSLVIPVRVMGEGEILPGVCQATHGWREANINEITPDDVFDPIDGFPMLKSIPVRIEKAVRDR